MDSENAKAIKYRYRKVYDSIRDRIADGTYPLGEYLPAEAEISRIYQVDRTTVRRALKMLSDEGLVEKHAGIGSKVLSTSGSAVATPRKTVAFLLAKSDLISERITHPFYSTLFYHIEALLKRQNYLLSYSTLSPDDNLREMVDRNAYAGIIFVNGVLPDQIGLAVSVGIPCVLANSFDSRVSCVMADNYRGAFLACDHLIQQGHRRIAIASGISTYATNLERMRGCQDALKKAGLFLDPEHHLETDWEFDSGYHEVKRMLQWNKVLPTALICFNDTIALGAIQAARELGFSVPEDISVTGFDNIDPARCAVPQLTTVDSHVEFISKMLVQALFSQLNERDYPPIKILTPVDLVIRGTTVPPKQD